jgi:hypothetical protein
MSASRFKSIADCITPPKQPLKRPVYATHGVPVSTPEYEVSELEEAPGFRRACERSLFCWLLGLAKEHGVLVNPNPLWAQPTKH